MTLMWARCRGPVLGLLTAELLVGARSGTATNKLPPSQPPLLPVLQPLETACAASLGSLPWPWGLSRLLSAQVPGERQVLWFCTLRGVTHLVASQPPPCLADFFVRRLGRAPAAPGSLPRYNSPERRRPGKAQPGLISSCAPAVLIVQALQQVTLSPRCNEDRKRLLSPAPMICRPCKAPAEPNTSWH